MEEIWVSPLAPEMRDGLYRFRHCVGSDDLVVHERL